MVRNKPSAGSFVLRQLETMEADATYTANVKTLVALTSNQK